jgi:hypothetical protein
MLDRLTDGGHNRVRERNLEPKPRVSFVNLNGVLV